MSDPRAETLDLPPWRADRASGELRGPAGVARLEPRVMDLLFLLGSRPGEVLTREELQAALWPDTVVGEDALARLVFKLRRALGDDPKAPRFVETLPKRGYRLRRDAEPPAVTPGAPRDVPPAALPSTAEGRRGRLPAVALVLLLAALALAGLRWRSRATPPTAAPAPQSAPSSASPPVTSAEPALAPAPALPPEAAIAERANDLYFQYSKADNEAAIALFERLVASHPDYAPAYAGLANALAQRVMRWPAEPPGVVHKSLRSALADGHLELPAARRTLERAEALARQAIALAPGDAASQKALGLVRSTRGDLDGALAAYRRAVEIDPDAWGALINIGDVLEIAGRGDEALPYFEAAYAAMTRAYRRETPRIQPWYAELATILGDRHRAKGRLGEAAVWYRRALEFLPLHPAATAGLARVLESSGDAAGAARLCRELRERLGPGPPCPAL